ncbi:WD40-repeat-containing domain protein [Suillus spraguei]|nr:WD40-repeat-containing domain protein [Suillus spraguei]
MPPPPTTSNGNAAAPPPATIPLSNALMTKLKPQKSSREQLSRHRRRRLSLDHIKGHDTSPPSHSMTGEIRHTTVVHASTKEDDTIRYHSLHDNKYLQYFKGHSGRVVSLEVSPIDDGFMSGSVDKTVRLWDLRAPTCRGLLNLPASPIVAYDSSGLVFAVGVNHYSRILLYDQANYDKDPFLTITLEDPTLALVSYPPRPIYMTSLSFSSNAKYILVGCSGDAHYILDAFEGHLLAKLEGHVGLERRRMDAPQTIDPSKGNSGEEVSWTPDSKYVVSGSLNGKIVIWDVQNLPVRSGIVDLKTPPTRLQPLATLDGHPGAELAFWLPDQSADNEEIAKELLRKK